MICYFSLPLKCIGSCGEARFGTLNAALNFLFGERSSCQLLRGLMTSIYRSYRLNEQFDVSNVGTMIAGNDGYSI